MNNWIGYAIISMVFAGLTSVIAKYGLRNVSGDAGLAIRTSMVFVLVWLNAFAFKHTKYFPNLSKNDILFLCVSGLTTTLSWIFYYKAIKIGDVSVVASIDKASLLITILLSVWLLREPLTWRLALGAVLILSGVIVLSGK